MQAQLLHALSEFDRYSGLFKQKAASAVDVDSWRANRDQAQAGVLGAQAQIELAQINLGYTTVSAPFDGRMDRHLIDAGKLVSHRRPRPCSPRSTRSTRSTPTSRSTSATCCASRPNAPRPGQSGPPTDQLLELGVANEDGFPHQGKLDVAAISLTPTTGTLELRGIFPNCRRQAASGPVRPHPRPARRAPQCPARAPDRNRPGRPASSYVLTVGAEDAVQRTGVQLGQTVGTLQVVESGLSADDRVIVDGLARARSARPQGRTARGTSRQHRSRRRVRVPPASRCWARRCWAG